MEFSQEILSLIQGGYDLHVHSGPDILPRKMDDIEMAERIRKSGMAGYAIKSHFFNTAERAQLMHRLYPECDFVGTISLNSYVGGINPGAMEMAALSGVRLVWFPTCDAQNEMSHVFGGDPNKKLPYWARLKLQMRDAGREAPSIRILDEAGRLKDEVHSVLDIIAEHKIILTTGHLAHDEAFALLKAAKEKGIRKIIVTHVDFPATYYTVEEQKELLRYGALMEHCYTTWATGKVEFDETARMIRELGPENCILATDLGQQTAIYPDEGMAEFARRLKEEKGFSDEEIRTMTVHNPRRLLDKE